MEPSTSKEKPKIIVIVGSTASGKTDLSIKLAQKINGEIVSADSRQIYRGMDIGTAKPLCDKNPKSLPSPSPPAGRAGLRRAGKVLNSKFYSGGILHRLINIKNPDESYTVAQYKKDCLKAIRDIRKRKKIPILVGGTGLYIKTVLDNLDIPKIKPNFKLREKLEKELRAKGLAHLYQKLIELDPEAAYIIDRQNPRRVIRALEITLGDNIPFSKQRRHGPQLFNTLKIGLNPTKEILKKRIEKRVDQMIKNGLIDEVKNLIKKYPPDLPALDAIGYREIINYLHGKISPDEAIILIKRNTWRYAKRQITWFKKDKEIRWFDYKKKKGIQNILNLTDQFLAS